MRRLSSQLLINHQLAWLRGILEQLRKARSESGLLCHLRKEFSSRGCLHAPPFQLLLMRSALWHMLWLVILAEWAALSVIVPALAAAARALIWRGCLRWALTVPFFALTTSIAGILLCGWSSTCSFVAITAFRITGTNSARMRPIKCCLWSSLLISPVQILALSLGWSLLEALLVLLSGLCKRPDWKVTLFLLLVFSAANLATYTLVKSTLLVSLLVKTLCNFQESLNMRDLLITFWRSLLRCSPSL